MKIAHKVFLVGALAAVVVLAVVAVRRTRVVERTAAPEIARTDLVLLSGRLHRVGETNAFSGIMLDYGPDGILLSRSAISNGLLHGLSQGFHTNGQVQVTEYFREGISDGLRTKWYPSGAKLSEATVVNGKLQGTFLRWHENGILAEQLKLVDDQPEGEAVSYFPSGFLKARATLQSGKLVAQNFYTDGQTKE